MLYLLSRKKLTPLGEKCERLTKVSKATKQD
jgi:hypothetical protein